ncbi:MAG: pyridoxal-phosphate dependent enzyme, partial [Salinivirgaceae bacterium]|nr:pyridoxal-phosphate dependent enzyme [Salinivirgaceae bacterium]
MSNHKFHYRCVDCGKDLPATEIRYLCPECQKLNTPELPPKGVLKVIYDYEMLKKSGEALKANLTTEDYFSLLPLQSNKSLPTLRVGKTPVYDFSNKELSNGLQLFIKDDSQNPTYSFKDRASAIVSAFAKEHGITTIAAASTGNAGS